MKMDEETYFCKHCSTNMLNILKPEPEGKCVYCLLNKVEGWNTGPKWNLNMKRCKNCWKYKQKIKNGVMVCENCETPKF